MPTLTINGIGYPFPDVGTKPWAQKVIDWATAVTNGMLQKSGGTFTLTSQVDFGTAYGLKSLWYKSRGSSVAGSGILRMANNETVSWRNASDAGNKHLKVNASDELEYDGTNLQPLTTDEDIIVRRSGNNTRLAKGIDGQVLLLAGGQVTWGNVAGTGDVTGPASSTDNGIPRFSGTGGKTLINSGVTIDGSNNVTTPAAMIAGSGAVDLAKALCPVGSIIPFYDFGTAGPGGAPLTFDAAYWCYCDGNTTTLHGAGTYTTPDMSNRYLVGFGTEAGGDMDTAAWATTPVGAASHQVDVSHTHTMQGHTHTGPSHTHSGPSHTHGVGTLQFRTGRLASSGTVYMYDSGGTEVYVALASDVQKSGLESTHDWLYQHEVATDLYTASGAGSTAAGGTGSTGAGGTGSTGAPSNNTTSSGGSSTQTIQPRSIRVRFIMRIK